MRNTIEFVEDNAGNVVTYRRHTNGGGLIGRGAKVGTTSVIGPATYVEAGARVGSGCRIGSGSWIDRKAQIGDHAVIGACSFVNRDIAPYTVAVGVPCRPIGEVRVDDNGAVELQYPARR